MDGQGPYLVADRPANEGADAPKAKRPAPEGSTGWWTRPRALTLTLFLLTLLAVYICWLIVRPFLPALSWALALAIVGQPLYEWTLRKVRHKNLAAALTVFFVALTIVITLVFVIERVANEASEGVETLRNEFVSGRWKKALEGNSVLAPIVRWAQRELDLKQAAEAAAAGITNTASSFLQGSVWGVAGLLITLFSLFYFFRDSAEALAVIRSVLPLTSNEASDLFARIHDTVWATIYGTFIIAIVQGVLGGLMFWWLQIPAPMLWGLVMALLALVPILGPFIVWVPAAIFLALEGSYGKAIILTLWGGVVIGLIDNMLYPMLVGKRLHLHTLPVFFSMIGGLMLFGASGFVLGPIIFAITMGLIDVWRKRTSGGRTADSSARLG